MSQHVTGIPCAVVELIFFPSKPPHRLLQQMPNRKGIFSYSDVTVLPWATECQPDDWAGFEISTTYFFFLKEWEQRRVVKWE